MMPARTNGSATTPRVRESHAYFGTRFVRQNLIRFVGIGPVWAMAAESLQWLRQILKVLRDTGNASSVIEAVVVRGGGIDNDGHV